MTQCGPRDVHCEQYAVPTLTATVYLISDLPPPRPRTIRTPHPISDKTAAHADRTWPSAWPPFARGSAVGAISAPHRCVCVCIMLGIKRRAKEAETATDVGKIFIINSIHKTGKKQGRESREGELRCFAPLTTAALYNTL